MKSCLITIGLIVWVAYGCSFLVGRIHAGSAYLKRQQEDSYRVWVKITGNPKGLTLEEYNTAARLGIANR